MAFAPHAPDRIGIVLAAFTDHEEGGLGSVLVQQVEQLRRVARGTVVEGQGNGVRGGAAPDDLAGRDGGDGVVQWCGQDMGSKSHKK